MDFFPKLVPPQIPRIRINQFKADGTEKDTEEEGDEGFGDEESFLDETGVETEEDTES